MGHTSKVREGKRRGEGTMEGRGGQGRGKEEDGCPFLKFLPTPLYIDNQKSSNSVAIRHDSISTHVNVYLRLK